MKETLDYLYSLKKFGVKLGLPRMHKLIKLLDNPQDKFTTIHVTGTNGKGSTSAFLASILQSQGYKVGLYTSPHLVNFNERIQINGKSISDENLAALVEEIKIVLGDEETTFFEFTTALMFLYFAKEEVDIAVIEVGLGGTLDATNIITPLVSVITNIALDHTNILGETKEQIASDKAGIIKKGVSLVTAEVDEKIIQIFREKCKDKNSNLILVEPEKIKIIKSNLAGQIFNFENESFEIIMLGEHQIVNACTAIKTIKVINNLDIKIKVSFDAIKNALLETKWPGRLDIISTNPFVIVDGAHNPQGIRNLTKFIEKIKKRKILIIGISQGRDIKKMLSPIAPLFDHVIISEGNFKPIETYVIAKELELLKKDHEWNLTFKEISNVEKAVLKAKSMVKKDDLILITGSLYLVGDTILHF